MSASKKPCTRACNYKFTSGTSYARSSSGDDTETFMDVSGYQDTCFFHMIYKCYKTTIDRVKDAAVHAQKLFKIILDKTSDKVIDNIDMNHPSWQKLVAAVLSLIDAAPTEQYTLVLNSGVVVKMEEGADNIHSVGSVPQGNLQCHLLVVLCMQLSLEELTLVFRVLALLHHTKGIHKDLTVQMCTECLDITMVLATKQRSPEHQKLSTWLFPDAKGTLQTVMPLFSRTMQAFVFACLMDMCSSYMTTAIKRDEYKFDSHIDTFTSTYRAMDSCIEALDLAVLGGMANRYNYLGFGEMLNSMNESPEYRQSLPSKFSFPEHSCTIATRVYSHLRSRHSSDDQAVKGLVKTIMSSQIHDSTTNPMYSLVLEKLSVYAVVLYVFMVWHNTRTFGIHAMFNSWNARIPHKDPRKEAHKEVCAHYQRHWDMMGGITDSNVAIEVFMFPVLRGTGVFMDPLINQPGTMTHLHMHILSKVGNRFPTISDANGESIISSYLDTEVLSLYLVDIDDIDWEVIGVRKELSWFKDVMEKANAGIAFFTQEQRDVVMHILTALAKAWIHLGYFGPTVSHWTPLMQAHLELLVAQQTDGPKVEVEEQDDEVDGWYENEYDENYYNDVYDAIHQPN